MSRKLTRRRFLQASTLAAVGAMAAACAPTPAPTAVPSVVPTAASAGATAAAPAAATAAPKPTAKAMVELVMTRSESPAQPIIQDAPSRLAITEYTGVKMKAQPVPTADYAAKMKVWLATNQVPDIMQCALSDITDYAQPSVLMPVMPLVDKYAPNVKKFIEAQSYTKRLTIGGELYVIPRDFYSGRTAAPMPLIRKDLLEKHGLAAPDDMDQLYQVLKELKKAYPDAVGWTGRRGLKQTMMISAYPMGSGFGSWKNGKDIPYYDKDVEGGKWVYGPIQPEFKDVLGYFARLYKEGLLDPNITTATDDQFYQRNSCNQGLFTWENMTMPVVWNQALRKVDPKATWGPLPVLKGKKGRRQNNWNGFQGAIVIGAGCKHPDRAIELFDWQISPLGLDITNWGIEGTHYTLKGTRPAAINDYSIAGISKAMDPKMRQIVPAVFEKYAKTSDPFRQFQSDTGTGQLDWNMLWDQTIQYVWDPPGEADAWYELAAKDPGLHMEVMVPPFTKDEAARLKGILTAVMAIVDPALEKVVLGQMSLSEWDGAVQKMVKAGAQDMEKIYNEAEARLK